MRNWTRAGRFGAGRRRTARAIDGLPGDGASLRLGLLAAGAFIAWRALRRNYDLGGRVALVSGGSRGLGLVLARELGRHGCRLVICARDERELEAARQDLVGRGIAVLAIRCDVADERQVQELVETAIARHGRIDVLINNASIIQVGPLHTMTAADFRQAMAVNFGGALNLSLAVIPQMRARRDGRIVNITSIGGKVALPHMLPYDCAKFATVGLSEGLATELARDGIRVTTVVPGLMRTGSPANALFKGEPEREFAWFTLGSASPLTAMSAERAARRIVLALRRGERFVTLSWQAKTLRLLHDLMPGMTIRSASIVNRMLPSRNGGTMENVRGMRLAHPLAPSAVTALVNRAARRHHEYEGTPRPSVTHARRVGLDRNS
jgi:NAD(P)-dependent dehydrogenase (short-subunit alcohol dehydrogenase family)